MKIVYLYVLSFIILTMGYLKSHHQPIFEHRCTQMKHCWTYYLSVMGFPDNTAVELGLIRVDSGYLETQGP